MNGRVELFQFRGLVACHCGVADIGIDLRERCDADAHRLKRLGEVHAIGRNHHSAAGYFVADELLGEIFSLGNELHLGRDLAPAGTFKLGHGETPSEAGDYRGTTDCIKVANFTHFTTESSGIRAPTFSLLRSGRLENRGRRRSYPAWRYRNRYGVRRR